MRCSKWLECSTQNRHILSTRHNYIAKGGFRKAILKDAGSVNITERSLQIGSVPNRSSNAMDTKWNNSNTIPFTGFELTFLGTSAGSPSVSRNPTGVCLRLENQNWMFDCAEGSLRQLMKSNIRVPMTNKIFITHLHGDHLYGLPGMLCTLDNHNANYVNPRTRLRARRPIHVYGPLGLFNYLNMAFTTSSTRMTNLEITVHELVSSEILSGASSFERHMNLAPVHQCLRREFIYPEHEESSLVWNVMDNGKIFVRASTLKHTVISFGYVVEEHNIPGRLIPDLAMAKGLTPGPAYRALKKGENVLLPSGKILFASEVTGPPALGRKVAIFGDTADSSKMFDIAKNCDILVHEATLSHTMAPQAVQRGHSTARMAGYCAKKTNATLLALTHFSHRFRDWSKDVDLSTTQHLVVEAQRSFGRRAVIAASDFLRIPIPRRPHIQS